MQRRPHCEAGPIAVQALDLRMSMLYVVFLLLAPGVDALGSVTRFQRGKKGGQRPSLEVARKLSPRLNVTDVLFYKGSDAAQQRFVRI